MKRYRPNGQLEDWATLPSARSLRGQPVHTWSLGKLGLLAKLLSLGLLLGLALNVSSAPVDTLLLLDNTTSMKESDPEFLARRALAEFVSNLPEDHRVAVLLFDSRVRLVAPFAETSSTGRQTVIQRLEQLDYAGRYSNSPAALERAIYELKRNARNGVTKRVVLVTAGGIDTGDKRRDAELSEWARDILASEASDAGIAVFGIAFTGTADFQLIQTLSYKTGGTYFRAFNPKDIATALTQIEAQRPQERAVLRERVSPPTASAESPKPSPETTAKRALESRPKIQRPEPITPKSEPKVTVETPQPIAQSARREAPAERTPSKATTDPTPEPKTTTPEIESPPKSPDQWRSLLAWFKEKLNQYTVGGTLLALGALIGAFFLLRRPGRRPRSANTKPTAHRASSDSPTLLMKDIGGVTGQETHDLTGNLIRISRVGGEPESHAKTLVIPDEVISREHAIIEYRDYGYWISDRGSVNGTFVNGERISGEKLLKHGDQVRFYHHEFEVVLPATQGDSPTGVAKGAAGDDRTLLVGMTTESRQTSPPPRSPDRGAPADADETELFSLASDSDERTSQLDVSKDEQEQTQVRPAKSRPPK